MGLVGLIDSALDAWAARLRGKWLIVKPPTTRAFLFRLAWEQPTASGAVHEVTPWDQNFFRMAAAESHYNTDGSGIRHWIEFTNQWGPHPRGQH